MAGYPTLIHERVDQARRGENPSVICRMPSGWAVLGDDQFFVGYSLLLPDPVVENLTDLGDAERAGFLSDMALIGEALHDCTDAYRINYEILGNSEAALHAHVFPRYQNEPERLRRGPVWWYDLQDLTGDPLDLDVHGDLQGRLATYLTDRLDASR